MKRTVKGKRKPGFVRQPARDNPKILLSYCPRCEKQIAGAPKRAKLKGAEKAHRCQRDSFDSRVAK